jgi:uncharacterized BrkB/YihY/UPF0761 family membrane protein
MVLPCVILGGVFSPTNSREGHFAPNQIKEPSRMRLKLVFAASALAALVGAGSCIALVLGVFSAKALSSPNLLVFSTLLLPVATIVFAAIFVYRHTARRRKLQALLTTLIATLLTLALFVIASIVSARIAPTEPTQPAGPHVAF